MDEVRLAGRSCARSADPRSRAEDASLILGEVPDSPGIATNLVS